MSFAPRPLAKAALLLLILTLPFGKHSVAIAGLDATLTDAAFLLVALLSGIALARREVVLRWSPAFAILLLYFVAMLVSSLVTGTLPSGAVRLASQA